MRETYYVQVGIQAGMKLRIHPSEAFAGITAGVVEVDKVLTWYEVPTECVEKYYLLEDVPQYKEELWVQYHYTQDDYHTPDTDLYLPISLFVNHTTIY
jgi:hypothetical protein